jgi:hypothetical protein
MYTFLGNERWPGLLDKSIERAVLIASNCGVKEESPLRTADTTATTAVEHIQAATREQASNQSR